MRKPILLLIFSLLLTAFSGNAWPAHRADLYSDTWVAADGLGRPIATHEETGAPRDNRFSAIFYFLWLGEHGQTGPHDISRILAANPGVMDRPDDPAWGPMHAYHHWGEPLFGYYLSDDDWVLKKHAQMLSDAGVDVIIFDVTNKATYRKNYMALCRAFTEVREAGGATPQIAFLCPFWDPESTVAELYRDLYAPGLYSELWFQWKGTPLIMADPEKVPAETHGFFTFRKPVPSYFTGPDAPDEWGWLEVYPQHLFRNSAGEAEEMTVGVAQNAVGDRLATLSEEGARGRSYHNGGWEQEKEAVNSGYNAMEQWERALSVDPEMIFITGWNEWVAMRLDEFNGVKKPVMFVDQFNHENSRDIEPMKGGHLDAYYYQMVNYIRRFKGTRPQPAASSLQTIRIDGDFSDWQDVGPEYRQRKGSAINRNHPGWGNAGPYVNNTARNDFVRMKVAHDSSMLYFMAETSNAITPPSDDWWMMLFLNTDRNQATGWQGYDYVLNRIAPGKLETATGKDWQWKSAGEIHWKVNGNCIETAIPRQWLHLPPDGEADIEFKWADNMREGDVMAFTLNGDAAPSGRFNYHYYETAGNSP